MTKCVARYNEDIRCLKGALAMRTRITIDPKIQHGKPVIKGTRVPVARVVGGLAGGMSFEEVREEYGVSQADICAALEFASELVEQEVFHTLPK